MANPENSDDIEFEKLCLRDFEQFHKMIEQGTIICPNPLAWKKFYEQFVKRADPDGKLKPLILTSWVWTTNEEKNTAFKEQFEAIRERYKTLGVRPVTWQKEIFDYFNNLEGQQSELVVV